MPICLFCASLVFAIFVARKRRLRLLSPFGVMMAFQALYNLTPWLTARIAPETALFPLLFDLRTIDIQLILASTANFAFSFVFFFFYRNARIAHVPRGSGIASRNYLLLSLPVFVTTCAFCGKYGWHQLTLAGYEAGGTDALGGMFTVTAYVKFFFVGIYLNYIYKFGLDKGAWVLIAEHILVMIIDGARATFLPVFIMTLFILADKTNASRKLRSIYLAAIGGLLVSIGTRAVIIHETNFFRTMLAPVAVEGAMGDYSCLQSIHGVETLPRLHYAWGATYVVEPFVWLIPRSIGRESLSPFSHWIKELSPSLTDEFAPMGGFYYLSEAIANFSYLGPAIVTSIFAGVLIWVDHRKNTHRLLYLAWMPTMGLMFVKVQFGNGFKLFLIELLSLQLLRALGRARRLLPQKPYPKQRGSISRSNPAPIHGEL